MAELKFYKENLKVRTLGEITHLFLVEKFGVVAPTCPPAKIPILGLLWLGGIGALRQKYITM